MRRVVVVVLLLLVQPAHASSAYGEPSLLFRLQDPTITEASGLVVSDLQDGVYFTHNDSGDYSGQFFAVGSAGQTLATYQVLGGNGYDIEDIARGPGATLFLGDIGDNSLVRPFVTVYEIAEPIVTGLPRSNSDMLVPRAHHLAYEDGRHNAETLLVDPVSGEIIIVTKESNGASGVYVALPPVASQDPVSVATLHRVGTIDFRLLTEAAVISLGRLATGGDIAPDGSRLVVRTYLQGFEWTLTGSVAASLASPPSVFYMPDDQGGEAICYTRDGASLITLTEGVGAPAHLLRVRAAVVARVRAA